MKKILIIRMSSIGDIVLSTSFIESVKNKFPNSQIDFLIKKEFSDIVQNHPLIDNIIAYDKQSGINGLISVGRALKHKNYDAVYDIHNVFRTKLLSFFFKVSSFKKIRKPRLKRWLLFYTYQNFFKKDFSHIKMYHSLLDMTENLPKTKLSVSNSEIEETKQYLSSNGVNERFITIVPGAAWKQKQWSIKHYDDLIDRILNTFSFKVVILGSKKDIICDQLSTHDRIINLKGETTLRMAMSILKLSDHTIGSDTGLLHISEAFDTPVTMILGPTSKETGANVVLNNSKIVANDSLWCRPCSQNGSRKCYRKEQYCLSKIDSDIVFNTLNQVVKS